MLYRYFQNNSHGRFNHTERTGILVFIEAASVEEANAIAPVRTDGDIYFDGVATGRDCAHCGSRWDEAWRAEETEDFERICAEEFASKFLDPDGCYLGDPLVIHLYRADGSHVVATKNSIPKN